MILQSYSGCIATDTGILAASCLEQLQADYICTASGLWAVTAVIHMGHTSKWGSGFKHIIILIESTILPL